ncbi:MAG: hypothetical protein WKG07_50105 [Hymenobacter sp.]
MQGKTMRSGADNAIILFDVAGAAPPRTATARCCSAMAARSTTT